MFERHDAHGDGAWATIALPDQQSLRKFERFYLDLALSCPVRRAATCVGAALRVNRPRPAARRAHATKTATYGTTPRSSSSTAATPRRTSSAGGLRPSVGGGCARDRGRSRHSSTVRSPPRGAGRVGRWLTDVSPMLPLLSGTECTFHFLTVGYTHWTPSLNLRFEQPVRPAPPGVPRRLPAPHAPRRLRSRRRPPCTLPRWYRCLPAPTSTRATTTARRLRCPPCRAWLGRCCGP